MQAICRRVLAWSFRPPLYVVPESTIVRHAYPGTRCEAPAVGGPWIADWQSVEPCGLRSGLLPRKDVLWVVLSVQMSFPLFGVMHRNCHTDAPSCSSSARDLATMVVSCCRVMALSCYRA